MLVPARSPPTQPPCPVRAFLHLAACSRARGDCRPGWPHCQRGRAAQNTAQRPAAAVEDHASIGDGLYRLLWSVDTSSRTSNATGSTLASRVQERLSARAHPPHRRRNIAVVKAKTRSARQQGGRWRVGEGGSAKGTVRGSRDSRRCIPICRSAFSRVGGGSMSGKTRPRLRDGGGWAGEVLGDARK